MNEKNKKIVEKIIDECINADVAFTEYDIIPEAIARGCKLDKSQMINVIKTSKIYPLYYNTTSFKVKNIVIDVHHPGDVDPVTYDYSDIINDVQKTAKYKNIKKDLDKALYAKPCLFDKGNNRYSVPSSKIRGAGFNAGNQLRVKYYPDRIELKRKGDFDRLIKIDCKHNVKIQKTTFMKAFNKLPDSLYVESAKGIVKIFPDN